MTQRSLLIEISARRAHCAYATEQKGGILDDNQRKSTRGHQIQRQATNSIQQSLRKAPLLFGW